MFTVKQETDSGHKMWPAINHVYTEPGNTSSSIGSVYCLFEAGGDIEFHAGASRQIIYVMNENGATVARYDIGNRLPSTPHPVKVGLGGAAAADPRYLTPAA